jgi:hypothetical protein
MLPIPTADVASLVLVTVVKPGRVLVTVTDKEKSRSVDCGTYVLAVAPEIGLPLRIHW